MNLRLLVLLFLVFACSGEKHRTNQISIELSPEKFVLEQKVIRKEDFEKELKLIIARKIEEGFQRDELVVNLKVDSRTRRGDIADIETAMRKWNVRRVNYSVLGHEQTSANNVYGALSFCC